jgi:hypothetical protein
LQRGTDQRSKIASKTLAVIDQCVTISDSERQSAHCAEQKKDHWPSHC